MRNQSRRAKRAFKPIRRGIRMGGVPRWVGSLQARHWARPNLWRKTKIRHGRKRRQLN